MAGRLGSLHQKLKDDIKVVESLISEEGISKSEGDALIKHIYMKFDQDKAEYMQAIQIEHSSPSSSDNLKKPLAELEIKEVSNLLETLNLSKYKTVFREHEVDGRVLDEVESLEEVKTLGIEQPLKAKVLIRNIMKYKAEGVPIKDIRERTELSGGDALTLNISTKSSKVTSPTAALSTKTGGIFSPNSNCGTPEPSVASALSVKELPGKKSIQSPPHSTKNSASSLSLNSVITIQENDSVSSLKNGSQSSNNNGSETMKSIRISGATGPNYHLVNGIYKPTEEMMDGFNTYNQVEDSDMWLVYRKSSGIWSVKRSADKSSNSSFAYVSNNPGTSPELAKGTWNIWDGKIWVKQPEVILSCNFQEATPFKVSGGVGFNSELINGTYLPTKEVSAGFTSYQQKENPNMWLIYRKEEKGWQFKTLKNKFSNIAICFIVNNPPTLPENAKGSWKIWNNVLWDTQSLHFTPLKTVHQYSAPVVVYGAKSVMASYINGIYTPTEEISASYCVYRKLSDPDVWLLRTEQKNWNIKTTKNKETTLSKAYVPNSPPTLPELISSTWKVYENKEWIDYSTIKVSMYHRATPLSIEGAVGCNAYIMNGTYIPTSEVYSELVTYQHKDNLDVWLIYRNEDKSWNIKTTLNKYSKMSRAYVNSGKCIPTAINGIWKLWNNENWVEATNIKIKELEYKDVASTVRITGATGTNAAIINGTFAPTGEVNEDFPVYQMKENPDMWLIYRTATNGTKNWSVKRTKEKYTTSSFAYISNPYFTLPEKVIGKWWIWDEGKWISQATANCKEVFPRCGTCCHFMSIKVDGQIDVKKWSCSIPFHKGPAHFENVNSLKRRYSCSSKECEYYCCQECWDIMQSPDYKGYCHTCKTLSLVMLPKRRKSMLPNTPAVHCSTPIHRGGTEIPQRDFIYECYSCKASVCSACMSEMFRL